MLPAWTAHNEFHVALPQQYKVQGYEHTELFTSVQHLKITKKTDAKTPKMFGACFV
jgi:type VI protein secretion system component Hcp